VSLAMSVDILPCLWIGESELSWHQTNDGAIFIMKFLDNERPSSLVETEDRVDLRIEQLGLLAHHLVCQLPESLPERSCK
jgi:hypothetical protein